MKNTLLVILGVLLGLAAAAILLLITGQPKGSPVTIQPTNTPAPIVVYINGDVRQPGVYRMLPGSRVIDVVKAAGGFLSGAQYGKLNLAMELSDGLHIQVGTDLEGAPTPMLVISDGGLTSSLLSPDFEPLDLNTATADELAALPGIGPTLASRIVEYRNINGDFSTVEDLGQVPGISTALLNEIIDYIVVDGVGAAGSGDTSTTESTPTPSGSEGLDLVN